MKINNNTYIKIAHGIGKSKTLQKVFKMTDSNPSLVSGGIAFVVGTTLKPMTNMALPGDKQDKIFAVGRSISTAIADILLAFAVFYPLNHGIDRAGRKLFNSKGTIYHNNPEMCTKFKSLFNRGFKIAFVPFFAWLKFSLINPIVKKIRKNKHAN